MCSVGGFNPIHAISNMVNGGVNLVATGLDSMKGFLTPQMPQMPDMKMPEAPPAGPAQAGEQRPVAGAGSKVGSAGSTLLTGGAGVAPSMLTLGKNTLLGQ